MQRFLLKLIPIQGILNSIIRTVSVCERLIVILIMHEDACFAPSFIAHDFS